jgi:prepilin-type N-terminal cleavage/methylation domain-containing protein
MIKGGKKSKGFTLIEVMVSMSLFVILILIINSLYVIAQRAYTKGAEKGELVQNARVCLDRISREVRQSLEVITALPVDNSGLLSSEIFFRDGHDITQITYIYYYLDNNRLVRQHRAYNFPTEPENYVTLSSIDEFGYPPEIVILEDRIIGEYFSSIGFWGDAGLIGIEMELEKNNNHIKANTNIYSRNR